QPRLVPQGAADLEQSVPLDEQRQLATMHDDAFDRVAEAGVRRLQRIGRGVEPTAVRLWRRGEIRRADGDLAEAGGVAVAAGTEHVPPLAHATSPGSGAPKTSGASTGRPLEIRVSRTIGLS